MKSSTLLRVITVIFLFCFFVADMQLGSFIGGDETTVIAASGCKLIPGDKNRVGASEVSLIYLLGTGLGVAALYYIYHRKRTKK